MKMPICVVCGKKGTKGSLQHPYCNSCFKVNFDDDYTNYEIFMAQTHGWEFPASYKPLSWWQRIKKRWFGNGKNKFR